MEIASPNSLWKDYDVAALPLNESALSDKIENGIRVREFYFDGFTTVDGRVRAYLKIAENCDAKGAVLYLSDKNGDDKLLVNTLYNRGYTVASLDYLGESDVSPRFTLYPKSLSACNARGRDEFDAPDDALHSCWYIWTCVARRATLLLKKLYSDKNIFALGCGLGGGTVYKLSVFDDGLTACATLLSVLPKVVGTDNPIINYRASLDNSAYATFCKVPLFMAVASNDEDGSLDSMSELADATASLKRLCIVERAFSGGVKVVYGSLDSFFAACAAGDSDFPIPEITATNSENNLYFNIAIKGDTAGFESPTLYTAFSVENPSHRNWAKIPIVSLGGGEYIAHINVVDNNNPVYAFVNFSDADGNTVSSSVSETIPKTLGIPSRQAVSHRMIYDGSMGRDVWTSPNGGTIAVKQGPFDIDGIYCDTHSLATFKLGDPLFRINDDALLQIMVSGKPQKLNITITKESEPYSCQIEITDADNWQKLLLTHLDFKSVGGPLTDWSRVIMLEFTSDEEFIISSVLWV